MYCFLLVSKYVEAVSDGNYGQTSSIVISQRPSGNEGNVVASLPNNCEEPVLVEHQSAPVIIQVSVSYCVVAYLISGIFASDFKFDSFTNFFNCQLPILFLKGSWLWKYLLGRFVELVKLWFLSNCQT